MGHSEPMHYISPDMHAKNECMQNEHADVHFLEHILHLHILQVRLSLIDVPSHTYRHETETMIEKGPGKLGQ